MCVELRDSIRNHLGPRDGPSCEVSACLHGQKTRGLRLRGNFRHASLLAAGCPLTGCADRRVTEGQPRGTEILEKSSDDAFGCLSAAETEGNGCPRNLNFSCYDYFFLIFFVIRSDNRRKETKIHMIAECVFHINLIVSDWYGYHEKYVHQRI